MSRFPDAPPIGHLADGQQGATPADDLRGKPMHAGSESAPKKEMATTETASSHAADNFTRDIPSGMVGDISTWDDQAVLAGIKKECEELRAIDSNYPGKYHRLGTFIIEARKRFGNDTVKQDLRQEGIDSTRAWRAEQIASFYSFEQAVDFPSLRAILKTLPKRPPQKPKPEKDVTGGGDHPATAPHEPPPAANDENILDRFVQLGIRVRELFGDDGVDQAVAQIKAHVPETFEGAFEEVRE